MTDVVSHGVSISVGRAPNIDVTVGTTGPRGPAGPAGAAGSPGAPGPVGTLNVVELTQVEYDALAQKQSNTIYVII